MKSTRYPPPIDPVELLVGVVPGCEDVVVHQHDLLPSVGHPVDVPIGTDGSLFSWYHAPATLVRAASGEEAVGGVGGDDWVYGVVWLAVVYLLRQP